MYMDNQIGFTMIELVCVLSLISIFAITFNIGFGWYDNIIIKSVAAELYENILLVKNSCICGEDGYIKINKESYQIIEGSYIVKKVKLSEGITIDSNGSSNTISFNYIGAPDCGRTIQIKFHEVLKYKITIVPCTGRVKLIKIS